MNEKKLQDAKAKLYEAMKPYIDENRCIDLSAFRQAQPKKYAILPHYFGSVDDSLVELKLVKIQIVKIKGASRDISFKDKLALDMLNLLRQTQSFDAIAQTYGVTKPLVSQLHKTLKAAVAKVAADSAPVAEVMED